VIGGRLTLMVAPSAAGVLAGGREVLLVSGTNGKTTTSALLAAALRTRAGVATNRDGANMATGLVTALAGSNDPTVVLETDEGWLPWATAQTKPAAVVLLNLTRDQLSRHHETTRVVSAWREAMLGVPLVVANADDPNAVWPALGAARQLWVGAGQMWSQDSIVCPRCGGVCRTTGRPWACTCGLRRPRTAWWLDDDDLVSDGIRLPLRLKLPGRFNRANAAMAVAAAVSCGIDAPTAVEAMRTIADVDGRFAVKECNGQRVRLLLAKNPAGWLETIQLVSDGDGSLVVALNSNGVDGRDPSWLYDVSFRDLAGRRIVVTGRRAFDLKVRLKLDGVPCVVGRDVVEALALLPPGQVDVVADYTAFQEARRRLARVSGQ
jgi:UDP-N-acetylmuramyl tripeptide synthase